MNCEICAFKNPKGTVTAVIIRDGKLLLLKRNEEPFKGEWDLPGGYMSANESPEDTIHKEIKEELGVQCKADFIGWFPGTASWKDSSFPILNHAYFVELEGEIVLDKNENSEYQWVSLDQVDPSSIAFDSNKKIAQHIKEKFSVDFKTLQELIRQLDASAVVNEGNFYRSLLSGHVSKKIVDGRLVGVGWIFSRRTFLRKQAVIEDVVVDEKERGKGYGEDITVDLMRWAKETGVEMIELTSGSHRIPANELYKKVGFQLHPTNHYLYKVE